jgi:hypothetical protein
MDVSSIRKLVGTVREFTANCDGSDYDWINQQAQHSEVGMDKETERGIREKV